MNLLKKILVPTDFSELSFAGVAYACSLAAQSDAQIHLVHVIESFSSRQTPYVDECSETMFRDKDREVLRQLENVSRTYRSQTTKIILAILRGDAVQEIIRYARLRECDLIVMATHGRTGVAHILMGSVAERIVRNSPIPVLSVKPEKMQSHSMEPDDIDEQLHLSSHENEINS